MAIEEQLKSAYPAWIVEEEEEEMTDKKEEEEKKKIEEEEEKKNWLSTTGNVWHSEHHIVVP